MDYDPANDQSALFFKTGQNKMHAGGAAHRGRADELRDRPTQPDGAGAARRGSVAVRRGGNGRRTEVGKRDEAFSRSVGEARRRSGER